MPWVWIDPPSLKCRNYSAGDKSPAYPKTES
jgi:hypothetical protein